MLEDTERKAMERKENTMTTMNNIIRQSQTLTLTSLLHTRRTTGQNQPRTTNQNRPLTTNQSRLLNQVCKLTRNCLFFDEHPENFTFSSNFPKSYFFVFFENHVYVI
jgi:hypothetical protein